MKTWKKPAAVSALVLAAAHACPAQSWDWGITSPVTPSPAGWFNDYLRQDDPYMNAWNLGVFYRARQEIKLNGGFTASGSLADFRTDVDNDNDYLLQKVMPRVGYTGEWFEVFVQGRGSFATGDERSMSGNGVLTVDPVTGAVLTSGAVGPEGSPEQDGPFDLQQAYINIGNHKEFPVSVKLGRQEFLFGEQRLVGALAWNNIGRQWDGVKARWQTEWFNAEVFGSFLVVPDDNNFNESNEHEGFSGVNITTKLLPKTITELSFWARNVGVEANDGALGSTPVPFRPPEAQDIYTAGLYIKQSPADWQNLDFGLQLYGQFGNFRDFRTPAAPRQNHEAYAAVAAIGYTWKESSFSPRVGIEYSFGSGDDDPTDGEHNTFVHLYPTGHLFYGYADFSSLQNVHNVRLQSSMMLTPRIKLALEGHVRWMATVNDNFYNVGGLPRGGITFQAPGARGTTYGINPDAGSFLGSEVDFVMTWQMNRYTVFEAAYCHFFRGDYIKDSLARVGSQDADYVYLQAVFNF